MADKTPGAAIYSYAGTTIAGITGVANIGYPSTVPTPIRALVSTLGYSLPVDLMNGVSAPRTDVFTCAILVRAADSITDPASANAAVVAGVQALQSLPESGLLTVQSYTGSGYVSCQARRDRFPFAPTPSNARHYVVNLTFYPTTEWA